MNWDPLKAYHDWFFTMPIAGLLLPKFGVTDYDDLVSLVVHRDGQFQTELFIVPRKWSFDEEHRHPDIDSFEVHLAGEIGFHIDGKPVSAEADIKGIAPNGMSLMAGRSLRVYPNTWHGASVGEGGGAFFSIQHWLNGVPPSSVGKCWEGPAVNDLHLKMVSHG